MTENRKFHRYKKLKKLIETLKYKEYPLHLVLGSYLAMMVWKPSKQLFLNYLLLNFKQLPNIKSDSVIITYSTERDDYIELISQFSPNITPQYVRINNTRKEKILGSVDAIFSIIKSIIFLREVECNLKDRLILICALSIAFRAIDNLERINIYCDKYIAFNSSYLFESFLSFYFRKRGIKTYSFQHGMYFNYINEIPFDIINYENVCANELLVWGEYTKEQVSAFLPEGTSCMVYGYPFNTSPNRESQNTILVLLPRDTYLKESLQLLDYLNNFNENYLIRAHPSIINTVVNLSIIKENIAVDKNKTLKETLRQYNYKAVIGFNSTSIFEACLYNQNILLFKTNNQEFENPGFKEISINSDLNTSIDNINSTEHTYFFKVR